MRWKLPRFPQQSPLLWCRDKGLSWGVQGFACVAVAWIIAQGFWWLTAPGSPAMAAKASPTLSEQANRVTARHFFDVAAAPLPSQSIDPGESPPPGAVDSRWRLLGTYVGSGGRSRALLMLEGSAEVVVAQIGDQLPSGHAVVDVLPELVELNKESQRSELPLRSAARNGHEQEAPGSRFGPQSPPPSAGATSITKDSR
jgi:hypothetical protein